LTRQIAETVSKAFAFCSSASCIASAEKRASALVKLATLPPLLSSLSPNFSHYIPDLAFRLLRHRLSEGSPTGWDCIDSEMQKIFQSPHFIPPSKADLMEILSLLSSETWGEIGHDLRVCTRYLHGDDALKHVS
jgi:hypothetical protein